MSLKRDSLISDWHRQWRSIMWFESLVWCTVIAQHFLKDKHSDFFSAYSLFLLFLFLCFSSAFISSLSFFLLLCILFVCSVLLFSQWYTLKVYSSRYILEGAAHGIMAYTGIMMAFVALVWHHMLQVASSACGTAQESWRRHLTFSTPLCCVAYVEQAANAKAG